MRAGLWGIALLSFATALPAQRLEEGRAGAPRPAVAVPDSIPTLRPPITPGRAFWASLAIPGAGQAALDRPYAGGVFLLVEAASLTMLHRSGEDLRLARRFARDSVPLTYRLDPVTGAPERDADGNPVVESWKRSAYGEGVIRSRRLQVEDWLAVLFFNHLFAAADAYVAAQLWDLPEMIGLRQMPFGPALTATFRFGRAPRR